MALEMLPPLMRGWAEAALAAPVEVPSERRADCGDCPMVGAEDEHSFLVDVRCCTYEPVLASFQVGAFFRDASPRLEAGRRRLLARIRGRAGVTPLGIDRPPGYPLWRAADESRFGKDAALKCGYLDAATEHARCTVHEGRNAVCATWFCRHERGAVGGRFWLALRAFLSAMESALAHHCLRELGVGDEALLALTLEQDRPLQEPTPTLYAALWGPWRYREQHFYAQCHALVSELSGEDALAIGGSTVARHAGALRAAEGAMRDRGWPERVQLGPRTEVERREGRVALRTYRDSDPIVLDEDELARVAACAGHPVETAARTLGRERLRVLLDHEVLVPTDP